MLARPGVNPRTASSGEDRTGGGMLMDSTVNNEKLGDGDEKLARLEEQLSKLGQNAARHPSDPPTRMNKARMTISGNPTPPGDWARRGFAGLVLAACVSVAATTYWQWHSDDTAKTAPPQPAPLA